ncbi:laminin subunit alpha-1-like isoform X2 [Brienomyrus brachyistius]|uniref:laminin subunit alpha-1-like isoform X2 n=1 Tax=Brienomyrus brachyistius TaxID=42636 RepID=UPI0020B2B92F|nr:laminin subunit alpha-1-like isoform X2 [Brienomyrus brachyistius]
MFPYSSRCVYVHNLKVYFALMLFCASAVESHQRGLFPSIFNLASISQISTNATCGDLVPETYCKLVEHVPTRQILARQCGICDLHSTNSEERHPITNAIDGTNAWWQSPSIKNGNQFHWVTITLDLQQVFQVAYVIVKAANSPRPGNWILERSLDNIEYHPWQYYAISDAECLARYNITPYTGPPAYQQDDEVSCTSEYSRLVPLEHGEIHTSLINGRPSADNPSPELLKFTTARYIRLRLQRIRTLNADLMTFAHQDPSEVDPIVTRRYYYSMKDISVGGMCICYGHARTCPWDPVTKMLRCECEHNTCGENCKECCPGHHQELWRPGTALSSNMCERCNCHNKSDDCFYSRTVAELELSLNSHGQRSGGGVCVSCSQNTAGVNCESCADGFFRHKEVSPYDDHPCVQCECSPIGSLSQVCVKDMEQAKPDEGLLPGQCPCKMGFASWRCDRCSPGYRDFPSCTPCSCNLDGSLGVDPCAECSCKANVMGQDCNRCKRGFYNLQSANRQGCAECFCFGVSQDCKSSSWSRGQVTHRGALMLPAPLTIPMASPLGAQELLFSWAAPRSFLGNKLTSYGGFLSYAVSLNASAAGRSRRLSSHFHIVIQGNGRTLRQAISEELQLVPGKEYHVDVEIEPGNFENLDTGEVAKRAELMIILADVAHLWIQAQSKENLDGELWLSSVALDIADPNGTSYIRAWEVESCECPTGYAGMSCELCLPGFYRANGSLHGTSCLECQCNGHASQCDTSGVCVRCEHYTTGPHCEWCQPGFYGDPRAGTPEDCQQCSCPLSTMGNNFSPTCHLDDEGQVTCDQCPLSHTGSRCDRCSDGYYGDPMALGGGCLPCDCSGNVDPEDLVKCDPISGECLKCTGHTAGWRCERCRDGYFRDAVVAKNCQACGCHVNGSYSAVCEPTTGQCDCKPNVAGRKCNRCEVGYYSLLSGTGCVACNCSQAGSLSTRCNTEGACLCIQGVAGVKCDHCAPNHYGTVETGCKECICAHTHGHCLPDTGECVCPPNTRGQACELCEDLHWGHSLETGCKPCDCSAVGALVRHCDLSNGQCLCRRGFDGPGCNQCAPGFSGYPKCAPCRCNMRGTREEFCNKDLAACICGDQGTCVCKDNVHGASCNKCKRGTFGLVAALPEGCSPCFCSGFSSDCMEATGLLRTSITLGESDQLAMVSKKDGIDAMDGVVSDENGVGLNPSSAQSSGWYIGPYYWQLPPKFKGNKLLSYGGKLRYAVTFHAPGDTAQVLMGGGHLNKAVIYLDMPDSGVKTEHDICMTEHKWKHSGSRRGVTRADFMSVLSNVEFILVKASQSSETNWNRLTNFSMETAVEAGEDSLGREVARFIEKCRCPSGYAGLSCQDCAPGYYRKAKSALSPGSHGLFVQPCVPCHCNNHSLACDVLTGICQDCQHNTIGDHCELCAPGHYGKVEGSVRDCSMCSCPPGNKKSFSATCRLEGMSDYRCDACEKGYKGQYCERCTPGYTGTPTEPDGRCVPCQCSASGALHPRCHPRTAQCKCKPGILGLRCDECEERHVLSGDRCISCDDECTGVILDEFEELDQSVKAANQVLVPYSVLWSMENRTREMKTLLSQERLPISLSLQAQQHLAKLSKDISALQMKANKLLDEGEVLDEDTEQRLTLTKELSEQVPNIRSESCALEETVSNLNKTLQDVNTTQLMELIPPMLGAMSKVNLSPGRTRASDALGVANGLQRMVQRDFHAPWQELEALVKSVSLKLSQKDVQLHSAQEQLLLIRSEISHTLQLLGPITDNLDKFHERKQSIDALVDAAKTQLGEAWYLIPDINNTLDSTATAQVLSDIHDQLGAESKALKERVDILATRLENVPELVSKVEDHTQLLQKKALILHTIFLDVQEAEHLAELADKMAPLVDDSVRNQSVVVIQRSRMVWAEGVALNSPLVDLSMNVTERSQELNSIRERIHSIPSQLPKPLTVSEAKMTSQKILESKELVSMTNASLQSTLQLLQNLSQELEESSILVAQASEDTEATESLLSVSQETVKAMESVFGEVEARVQHLSDRLKPLRILGEHLSRNLSEIRELIKQARKQASSIKVAVLADQDCVRTYKPELSSSNLNTLTLTVKTSEADNLLFYMGSNSSDDFLAVEMHGGMVSFLWDVGSGHAKLEYPDLQIDNDKWYRIHARRFGRRGSLNVWDLQSDLRPAVEVSSPGPSVVLEVDESTLIFVGGLGSQIKKSEAVDATHFSGCMAGTWLNGKNIGLWNYVERHGKCQGCSTSLHEEEEEASFQFDGSAYAVVQKALRSSANHIVMNFKTFTPNGLLIYMASDTTKDFLAIELVDGRVQVTIELGEGPLILSTAKPYNTGKWHQLTLRRDKYNALLTVIDTSDPSNREELEGQALGTDSALNRSEHDPIYIGGLPDFRSALLLPSTRSFTGCIKDVEISRTNFDLLDNAYGVTKGCVLEPIYSVTVRRGGFLELPALTLLPQAEVLVSFSTYSGNGLILAGFTEAERRKRRQNNQPFLAVALASGQLEAHVSAGEGDAHKVVLQSSTGTFSDGQKHSLILQWQNRTVTLLVDEDSQDTVTLGPSSEDETLSQSVFYVGGLPPGMAAGSLGVFSSFYGCISNLAVDSVLLNFSSALQHQGIEMSCMLDLPDATAAEPPQTPPASVTPPSPTLSDATCAVADQTESIPGAYQFGLLRHSHMTLNISEQAVRAGFSLELSLRTFASSGLLFHMAAPTQTDHATLQLWGGQLFFTCNLGRNVATASLPEHVDDGQWHAIKADFGKRSLKISVDGQESSTVQAKGKTNNLDVRGALYLGGLPPNYKAKNIGNVTHSIAGCVRGVTLNGVPLDTENPIASYSTSGCFSLVQKGTFLDGSGFAAFAKEGYKVGMNVKVDLEFRTTALNGVLLGVSSTKADAIGLELINGQVRFHVNNGAGLISAAYDPEEPGQLCDGHWHTVTANKSKHGVSLTVDGVTVHSENPHLRATSVDSNNPVYVGGFPAGVTQSCLTTSAPFKGCISNVRLSKGAQVRKLDFSKAFILRGIIPYSCPGAPASPLQ